MVIFLQLLFIGEAKRGVDFDFIFRLVRTVAALALGLPNLNGGHGVVFADKLAHIVFNPIFVNIFVRVKGIGAGLVF